MTKHITHNADEALQLRKDEEGLFLISKDGLTLRADFLHMIARLRPNCLSHELLVRAAKVKRTVGSSVPTAVDATAGLGEDSLLLAAAGFEVTLIERDETIAALLVDALRRASQTGELAASAQRMHVVEGDSTQIMAQLTTPPDVVYLDPMFPTRRKSAAVKKKFQLLHALEKPCTLAEQEALLCAAYSAHPHKIVIKRPAKAEALAGQKPSYTVQGKTVRYDVLVEPSPVPRAE